MNNAGNGVIIPYRNIPFDMGTDMDIKLQSEIGRFLDSKYRRIEISGLLSSISNCLLFAYQLEENIRLYIFKTGIGVFTIKDTLFDVSRSESYAIEYCHSRKKAHTEYLNMSNVNSPLIADIVDKLRELASHRKCPKRVSSGADWENHGLSYVMTVSFVYSDTSKRHYRDMSDDEKRNLQIMLEPSIVHEEDTIAVAAESDVRAVSREFDLTSCDEPRDWIRNDDYSIYISWAAVVVYSRGSDECEKFLEALEVDLQAMWMYVYCKYEDLKFQTLSKKLLASELRKRLYDFNKSFNEFLSISDSSVTSYIRDIRGELIRTSNIREYADKYKEYIEFCIVETQSIEEEKQKKYGWLNDILLFIIAYVQVMPMIDEFMAGGLKNVNWDSFIIMAVVLVAAVVIIIKKN